MHPQDVIRRNSANRALFTLTVLLSAALLSMVQPMFAKLALPHLGGTPVVWSAATVVYQSLLLIGYAAAGWIGPRLSPRRVGQFHVALLMLSAATLLPLAPPVSAGHETTIPLLLQAFVVGVGVPYLALTFTSPLIQSWFARSDDPQATDPYFLYAASNIGSLVTLLAYPVLVEPWIGLSTQTQAWRAGYVVLAAIIGISAWRVRDAAPLPAAEGDTRVDAATVLAWTGLASLPSALVVAQTNMLSTDIAPMPLVWVLPLATYMLTWVVAFSGSAPSDESLSRLRPLGVAIGMAAATAPFHQFVIPLIGSLVATFVISLAIHTQLRNLRPPPQLLGVFYTSTSLGGVLGSTASGLIAPLVLSGPWETLLIYALTAAPLSRPGQFGRWTVAVIGAAVTAWGLSQGLTFAAAPAWLVTGVQRGALVACLLGIGLHNASVVRSAVAVGVLVGLAPFAGTPETLLHRTRSLFGSYRVTEAAGKIRLYHGTTLHGIGNVDDTLWPTTTSYYYEGSPISDTIRTVRQTRQRPIRVAIVGLGVGTMACLRKPDEQWDYFEIDPAMVAIARNADWFHFLERCDPGATVTVGDARLTLPAFPDTTRWDVIVLDAFSSDAIPSHLLTEEAIRANLSRSAEDGLLTIHISNRHLDLRPSLAATARELGLHAAVRTDLPDSSGHRSATASRVVAMSRSRAPIDALLTEGWLPLDASPTTSSWTDDRTDMLSPLMHR